VRVTLTALGRRLARDGVEVTATIKGHRVPRRSWTIPLRVR
jgi:hypothetical protein